MIRKLLIALLFIVSLATPSSAMIRPLNVGPSSRITAGNSSTSVTKPTGILVGMIWVVSLQIISTSATTVNTPAGWTATAASGYNNNQDLFTFYRTVDGTEGASQTFSFSNTGNLAGSQWYSTAMYDDGGGTISVETTASGNGGGFVLPPNTANNWDTLYMETERACAGQAHANEDNTYFIHNSDPFYSVGGNLTNHVQTRAYPTPHTMFANDIAYSGIQCFNDLWNYIIFKGGTASPFRILSRDAFGGGAGSGAQSLSLTNPASTNDRIVAYLTCSGTGPNPITEPTGTFTLVASGLFPGGAPWALFSKIEQNVSPGIPTSYSFSCPTNAPTAVFAGTISSFYDQQGTQVTISNIASNTATGTVSITAPSTTTTATTDMALFLTSTFLNGAQGALTDTPTRSAVWQLIRNLANVNASANIGSIDWEQQSPQSITTVSMPLVENVSNTATGNWVGLSFLLSVTPPPGNNYPNVWIFE